MEGLGFFCSIEMEFRDWVVKGGWLFMPLGSYSYLEEVAKHVGGEIREVEQSKNNELAKLEGFHNV